MHVDFIIFRTHVTDWLGGERLLDHGLERFSRGWKLHQTQRTKENMIGGIATKTSGFIFHRTLKFDSPAENTRLLPPSVSLCWTRDPTSDGRWGGSDTSSLNDNVLTRGSGAYNEGCCWSFSLYCGFCYRGCSRPSDGAFLASSLAVMWASSLLDLISWRWFLKSPSKPSRRSFQKITKKGVSFAWHPFFFG